MKLVEVFFFLFFFSIQFTICEGNVRIIIMKINFVISS